MKGLLPRALCAVLIGMIAGGLVFRVFMRPALNKGLHLSQAVYDREGNLLRLSLSRDQKYRLWLPVSGISPVLVKTTVLHEDRHFYRHFGVNPASLFRAVWHTYVKADRRMGGSTITMQLARIRYGIHSRSPAGKFRQMLFAVYLETFYSKKEILEAYLNIVPYGLNIEGIGAASFIYFKKSPASLTLPEALTLSVIPQSPLRRIPVSGTQDQQNRHLLSARAVLFQKWAAAHPGDRGQFQYMGIPMVFHSPPELPFLAPHFVNQVLQADPFDSEIRTTLDLRLQKMIERLAAIYREDKSRIGITNAAVILVDYRTMEVKALLGSADFLDPRIQGQVNGTTAKRSPGSAIKPFIYALGIDQGIIHPKTMLKDTAMSFGGYNPENFDNDFAGPMSAKEALIRSRNVPAVDLASRLGGGGLHRFFREAGITRLRDESFYGMTLALGSAEISLQEMAGLYAMLANGGVLRHLKTGQDHRPEAGKRLLSREACFMVLDMLKDNPRPFQGYPSEWINDSVRVSWKTGTSYGYRDAWSAGVFGPYVLAVWIGNFNGEGNPAFIGREAAAPLFFQIIDSMKSGYPEVVSRQGISRKGLNLSKVKVCSVSGMMPGPACGHTEETWFMPGTSPIKVCDVHRSVSIDIRTGLRACTDDAPGTRLEVYEFWPSDMLAIFRQAGIPRRVPPPYNPDCLLQARKEKGLAPRITSPQADVIYSLRAASYMNEKIPFQAVTDADSTEINWFVDNTFIGRSRNGETFFWSPKPGKFTVRAVDDQGRSASRGIVARVIQ